jgi:hypothetical protein
VLKRKEILTKYSGAQKEGDIGVQNKEKLIGVIGYT